FPARTEIYNALQNGELEARARKNGKSDLVVIKWDQWLSLRFHSIEGHDLALPVDINDQKLPLPHSFDDYLTARAPIDAPPAVWPDPLFRADQVMTRWPAAEQKPAPGSVEPIRREDQAY